jgi:signal transduction histidine kinase
VEPSSTKPGETIWSHIKTLGDRHGPIPGTPANTVVLCLILASVYFALGRLAFAMAISEGSATSVAFLPEGAALAFAILFGWRIAPGIFLGQLCISLSLGVPWLAGASFGLVNALENTLGGILFWRLGVSPRLDRPRDVIRLFTLSALLLQPLAAAAKVLPRLMIASPDNVFHLSVYSWAGNTLGQFLLVPLLLTWCCAAFRFEKRETLRALGIVGGYFLAVALFKLLHIAALDNRYWFAVFGAFYLVLVWVAVQSRSQITALTNLLATMGFLWVITTSPESLLYFATQDRVLYADILILGGIVTALVISALFSQLTERTRQLRAANEAKEKIFSVIGHDLRTPITSIQWTLGLMGKGALTQEDFHRFQPQLQAGSNQAIRTLENLMEWGDAQRSGLRPAPAEVSLRATAEEAAGLLRLQATAKNITITLGIPDDARVFADYHQVASILRNLLSNALKFTHEGGSVTITAQRAGAHWRTDIRDTGIGLTSERAASLLAQNHRPAATAGTANERGHGLGLQLCRDFAQANGGSLTVQSEPTRGSTFSLHLPATSPTQSVT